MRETNEAHGPEQGLALTAFLYAAGELSLPEAEAFEQRLGEEQAAREALLQAVQLAEAATNQPVRPDPGYRDAVRRRLQPGGVWRWFLARRLYRGHPVAWSGLGASFAVVAMLWLNSTPSARPGLPVGAGEPVAAPTVRGDGFIPVDASVEIANAWAELNNSDHLNRAREEEMRRKTRAENKPKTTKGTEDRRSRVLSHPMIRP